MDSERMPTGPHGPVARRSAHGGASPQAAVWLTTPDADSLLRPEQPVVFEPLGPSRSESSPENPPGTAAVGGRNTVTIDSGSYYQSFLGCGASIADSSASLLGRLPADRRDAVMEQLFSRSTGIGLSYLRQPIGSSAFVAGPRYYTCDDVSSGHTDFDLAQFSVARDEAGILPLLRQARRLNPDLKVMATPWSAPAWLKTNDSLVGGRLIESPQVYQAYATYLLRFVEAYRANGVNVDAITVQNEPQNRTPAGYPGTDMPSWQEAAVIEDLGPMLQAAHLHTEIFAYDHNWTEHPNDIANTPPDETADINDYPQQVLDTPAAKWVSGVAFHCYYGDPSAMTAFHEQYPKMQIMETECSGSQSSDPANTFCDTLKWHSRNLEIGSPRNWSSTVINWNLALNQDNGPHVGGCATCTGILTIGPGDTVTPDAEYYALGQLSRFVKPGAVRFGSTSFGTTGWNGQVMDAAFKNPDGSTVLVAHNENDNAQAFAVQEGDRQFTYTLPGDSLATFVWTANPAGPRPLRQVDPAGWTATADPNGPTNSCCTADVAANAVDADASTRYSTGEGQAPGQYLQVDFGKQVPARQVVFDTGASTGDYPRAYSVEVSRDGTDWTTVVADATGTGQFSTVALDGRPIRYVRITLIGTDANNWCRAGMGP